MNTEFNFEELKKVPVELATVLTEKPAEPEQPKKPDAEFFQHTATDQNATEFFNDQPQQQQQQIFNQPVNSSLNAGELFPTDLIVELADSVFSKGLALILTKATKKQVPAYYLAATKEEKNTLKPVVKTYLNSVNFVMTPLNALIVAIAAIYGSKTIEVINITKSIKNGNSAPVINSDHKQEKPKQNAGGGRKAKTGEPSAYMRKKYGNQIKG